MRAFLILFFAVLSQAQCLPDKMTDRVELQSPAMAQLLDKLNKNGVCQSKTNMHGDFSPKNTTQVILWTSDRTKNGIIVETLKPRMKFETKEHLWFLTLPNGKKISERF